MILLSLSRTAWRSLCDSRSCCYLPRGGCPHHHSKRIHILRRILRFVLLLVIIEASSSSLLLSSSSLFPIPRVSHHNVNTIISSKTIIFSTCDNIPFYCYSNIIYKKNPNLGGDWMLMPSSFLRRFRRYRCSITSSYFYSNNRCCRLLRHSTPSSESFVSATLSSASFVPSAATTNMHTITMALNSSSTVAVTTMGDEESTNNDNNVVQTTPMRETILNDILQDIFFGGNDNSMNRTNTTTSNASSTALSSSLLSLFLMMDGANTAAKNNTMMILLVFLQDCISMLDRCLDATTSTTSSTTMMNDNDIKLIIQNKFIPMLTNRFICVADVFCNPHNDDNLSSAPSSLTHSNISTMNDSNNNDADTTSTNNITDDTNTRKKKQQRTRKQRQQQKLSKFEKRKLLQDMSKKLLLSSSSWIEPPTTATTSIIHNNDMIHNCNDYQTMVTFLTYTMVIATLSINVRPDAVTTTATNGSINNDIRSAASAMTTELEKRVCREIPNNNHNDYSPMIRQWIANNVIKSILKQYNRANGNAVSDIDLHVIASLARSLLFVSPALQQRQNKRQNCSEDGTVPMNSNSNDSMLFEYDDETLSLAAQIIATNLHLPLVGDSDTTTDGINDNIDDDDDNSIPTSNMDATSQPVLQSNKMMIIQSTLALTSQLRPYQYISPIDILKIAGQYKLWHAAERIVLSVIDINNNDSDNNLGVTATVTTAAPTTSQTSRKQYDSVILPVTPPGLVVHTLIDCCMDMKLYRSADNYATQFFDYIQDYYTYFLDVRYLHACDTIVKCLHRNASTIIDQQVLRMDESIVQVQNQVLLLQQRQSNDDSSDIIASHLGNMENDDVRDYSNEIRIFAIRQLEERGDVMTIHRLIGIWGMNQSNYIYDDDVIKAAIERRKQKYLQWDDTIGLELQDIPQLSSTPAELYNAFQKLGFYSKNDDKDIELNYNNIQDSSGLSSNSTNETMESKTLALPAPVPLSSSLPNEKAFVYGFDAEWGDDEYNGVGVLQISNTKVAILIDVPALCETVEGTDALEKTVGRLFSSPNVIMVGFSCRQDLVRLRNSFGRCSNTSDITTRRERYWFHNASAVRDIQAMIAIDQPQLKDLGLSRCCEYYIGKPLDKSEQCSMWHSRPLTKEQRIYASLDAYVCAIIYEKLHHHLQ